MFNKNLFNYPYHEFDLSKYKFLVTGGAGFIGSNLVEYLLKYGAGHVRVLDNLSNGYIQNIKDFFQLDNFEFIEGDIRDNDTCKKAARGMDFISHQAALGSVPRSIGAPVITNEVNISGFLNMLVAAKDSDTLKRFVYAASSSTYGDSSALPKVEGSEGRPLSPYAVTKLVNELYADVFSRVYNFHSIGLRYFNVFGPKQNPNNPYAAVIPIFCKHFIESTSPTINGDGNTSRDFTFVENAVQANVRAFGFNPSKAEVFNVACGEQYSLNRLIDLLKVVSGKSFIEPIYASERVGDIRHSKASIRKIEQMLKYENIVKMNSGLNIVYEYYKENSI